MRVTRLLKEGELSSPPTNWGDFYGIQKRGFFLGRQLCERRKKGFFFWDTLYIPNCLLLGPRVRPKLLSGRERVDEDQRMANPLGSHHSTLVRQQLRPQLWVTKLIYGALKIEI